MIREIDLVSYLPPFMQNNETLVKTLEAENPEFNLLWKAADWTLKNVFIATADEYGIARIENILNLIPQKGETLNERRTKLMMKYNLRSPYTLPFLQEMLASAVGKENYIIEHLSEQYRIKICVLNQNVIQVKNIYNTVNPLLPGNMILLFYAEYREFVKVEIKQAMFITFTTAFYPQFNLPELLLNGSWKLDGSKTLNGYDGSEHIDLYPVEIELQDKVKNVQREKLGVCFLVEARRKIVSSQEIIIQTEAYPRFNLPEFGSDRKTDLYPVEIKIQVKAAGVLQEKPKIIFLTETKEKITNKPEIKVQVSTIHHGTAKEKITIQTEAEVKTGTGEIFMDNQNFLDGSWELDGSRTLNGGDYQW